MEILKGRPSFESRRPRNRSEVSKTSGKEPSNNLFFITLIEDSTGQIASS